MKRRCFDDSATTPSKGNFLLLYCPPTRRPPPPPQSRLTNLSSRIDETGKGRQNLILMDDSQRQPKEGRRRRTPVFAAACSSGRNFRLVISITTYLIYFSFPLLLFPRCTSFPLSFMFPEDSFRQDFTTRQPGHETLVIRNFFKILQVPWTIHEEKCRRWWTYGYQLNAPELDLSWIHHLVRFIVGEASSEANGICYEARKINIVVDCRGGDKSDDRIDVHGVNQRNNVVEHNSLSASPSTRIFDASERSWPRCRV